VGVLAAFWTHDKSWNTKQGYSQVFFEDFGLGDNLLYLLREALIAKIKAAESTAVYCYKKYLNLY
jgi:hypothetical protein